MNISMQHYNGWNTFADEKLKKHFLYITRWSRDQSLKDTMDKLMIDRGLKIFSNAVVNAEFMKAMQTTYFKDEVLVDRVYEALYVNNQNEDKPEGEIMRTFICMIAIRKRDREKTLLKALVSRIECEDAAEARNISMEATRYVNKNICNRESFAQFDSVVPVEDLYNLNAIKSDDIRNVAEILELPEDYCK